MASYNCQWPHTGMTQSGAAWMDGFDEVVAHLEELSRNVNALVAQRTQRVAVNCDYCDGNHPTHQCTINFKSAWYGGNFGDYPNNYDCSDAYNQDWGYHPDSTWSYNYEDQYYAPSPAYAPEFSCPPSLPQEENSNVKELGSQNITSIEEIVKSQQMAIQNLENQMGQLIIAFNDRYKGEWPNDLVPEANEFPMPKLQPDVLIDDDSDMEETCGKQEKEAEDPTLSPKDDDKLISIVSHIPSPPKLKDLGGFAVPCPLSSHVIGKALCDIGASLQFEPWRDEVEVHEKIDEDPLVFEKLNFTMSFIDTSEQAPSYFQFIQEDLYKNNKLGELETLDLPEAMPSDVSPLLMDEANGEGFFLLIEETECGSRLVCMHAMQIKEMTARRHAKVIFAIEPD